MDRSRKGDGPETTRTTWTWELIFSCLGTNGAVSLDKDDIQLSLAHQLFIGGIPQCSIEMSNLTSTMYWFCIDAPLNFIVLSRSVYPIDSPLQYCFKFQILVVQEIPYLSTLQIIIIKTIFYSCKYF
jgi:hypothetical protein